MSFQFPKPALDESTNTPSDSDSASDFNYSSDGMSDSDADYLDHNSTMQKSGPDYDELIIPLSLFAFNRLSPSDQRQQAEYVRCIVKYEQVEEQRPEESDEAFRLRSFSGLFRKLTFSYQLKLLDRFFQKLEADRQLGELISSFKQLDAKHQQQLIENCVVEVPPKNLRNPWESDDDFRLRRFTELSTFYTAHVYKRFVAWKNAKKNADEQEKISNVENNSLWKSSFSEFFLGFSVIWFKEQSASGQNKLIEQLLPGIRGSVVIQNRLQDESEEDFKLRRFRELCRQVVDFGVQMKLLDNARSELESWEMDVSRRFVLKPQECDRAAALVSDLSTLAFSLLSAKYQQHMIDGMSYEVGLFIKSRSLLAPEDLQTGTTDPEEGEAIRMRRFRGLFNQAGVNIQYGLFSKMRGILCKLKILSEAVHFFRGLRSEDQEEMIEKLMHRIRDSTKVIIEKFSGESEEDFRLRRFSKVCMEHLLTWRGSIDWPETDRERIRQGTSDNEEESPYAKFLFDASVTWFKARCANYRRNPLHAILFDKVQFCDGIEKLPEESKEDFRLRRFRASFKRLDYTYKNIVVNYIQHTLAKDLGVSHKPAPKPKEPEKPKEPKPKEPEKPKEKPKAPKGYGRIPVPPRAEWNGWDLKKLQGQTATNGGASSAGTGATT